MTTKNRAQWMADGTLGLMVHYLISPEGTTQEEKTAAFNKTIDGFDLDHFMKQFEKSGANWLIFTIGQNTGYYVSPNATLDRIAPGHTPKRDLILEIAKRVKKLHKRFIAYLPCQVSTLPPPEIQEAFHLSSSEPTLWRKTYLSFLRDYSIKLGLLHDGWWFDGAYPDVTTNGWRFEDWCDAARAGNPSAALAFNDGAFCIGRMKPVTPLEDYHPGEVHMLENGQIRTDYMAGLDVYVDKDGHVRMPNQEPKFYMPDSQFVDGVQWHALVPVDCTFTPAIHGDWLKYTPEEMIKFVRACKKVHGAVTFNLVVDNKGHIQEDSLAKFKAVSAAVLGKSEHD